MGPLLEFSQRPTLLAHQHRDLSAPPLAHVAQLVVPHHLDAVLWNREGNRGASGLLQAPAVATDLALSGELFGALGDFCREATATACRVDVQTVARVGLDQRHLASRQLRLVLREIFRIDGIQRLVGTVGVAVARLPAARSLGQTAFPGRDAAVGIGSFLCAERGQLVTELGQVGRGRRLGAGNTEQRHQGAAQQGLVEINTLVLLSHWNYCAGALRRCAAQRYRDQA